MGQTILRQIVGQIRYTHYSNPFRVDPVLVPSGTVDDPKRPKDKTLTEGQKAHLRKIKKGIAPKISPDAYRKSGNTRSLNSLIRGRPQR